LLGMVWNFIIDADDDVRLLIPSFTIVGPAGKVLELQRLADQLEKLASARVAVHEIVARAIQVGRRNWDRDKAKALIRRVVGGNLLDEKALGSFLDVYEYLGPMGACSIGHYALNAAGLTLAVSRRAMDDTRMLQSCRHWRARLHCFVSPQASKTTKSRSRSATRGQLQRYKRAPSPSPSTPEDRAWSPRCWQPGSARIWHSRP